MVAISEYQKPYPSLPSVKNKDISNFRSVFENELTFKFVCNDKNSMTKEELLEYLEVRIIHNEKLRQNVAGYDGIIMIFCGHGRNGEEMVTSDGLSTSIVDIAHRFNREHLKSFAELPKIFIMDMCRDGNVVNHKNDQILDLYRGDSLENKNENKDSGFVKIWSTSKGQKVPDKSLLSECWKRIKSDDYKELSLSDLVTVLNKEVSRQSGSNSYCVELTFSAPYVVALQKNRIS